MRPVAIFGGSFNPPGLHHRQIVQQLINDYDVKIVPCGRQRTDKLTNRGIDPIHRATLCDLNFGDLPNVEVLLFDLEHDQFTPTVELDRRLAEYGERWYVVGSELIAGGSRGQADVQHWIAGRTIWSQLKFIVVEREDYPIDPADLPPTARLIKPEHHGSSTEIRQRRFTFQPITGLVRPSVETYIKRYDLYQGTLPRSHPTLALAAPRLEIVIDEHNPRAVVEAERLATIAGPTDGPPDLIVVMGGDGTMLRAIRQHWRKRRPFLGVNFGTVGFLLNDLPAGLTLDQLRQEWIVHQAPLLYVQSELADGRVAENLAFNDAYLDAESGKAGWIEVAVDDRVVIPKLVGDGALVATPAGSSAYARAMGATPVPIGTPSLVLVGSNVFLPTGWRHAQLDNRSTVRLRNVDPTPGHNKRPLYGFIDGLPQGPVEAMTIRHSRVAAAELLFLPGHDPRQKLTRIQFPPM